MRKFADRAKGSLPKTWERKENVWQQLPRNPTRSECYTRTPRRMRTFFPDRLPRLNQSDKSSMSVESFSSLSVMRSNAVCLLGSGGGIVRGSTPGGASKDVLDVGGGAADEDDELAAEPMLRLACHNVSALASGTCRYPRPQKAERSSSHCRP